MDISAGSGIETGSTHERGIVSEFGNGVDVENRADDGGRGAGGGTAAWRVGVRLPGVEGVVRTDETVDERERCPFTVGLPRLEVDFG